MIEGEKIIYVHKATGVIVEQEYLKQIYNSNGLNHMLRIRIEPFKVISEECTTQKYSYDYVFYEIIFSDDFETLVVNEKLSAWQYDKAIRQIISDNNSISDIHILRVLNDKKEELIRYRVKYGYRIKDEI